MRVSRSLFRLSATCLAAAGCATAAVPSATSREPAPGGSSATAVRAVASRGIDPANMDTTCKACQDFYRYANGGWLDRNPIPRDRSSVSSYDEVGDRTTATLHTILREAAQAAPSAPGTLEAKLGTFFATCMDSARAEAEGAAPVMGDLRRLAGVRDRAALAAEMGRLAREGTSVPFDLYAGADDRDVTRTIAGVWQTGITLPTREYYLRDDSASRAMRDSYRRHVARMLVLTGSPEAAAEADARRVLEMETALARASMAPVEMRDPAALYHKMPMAELRRLTPHLDWDAYLRAAGIPAPAEVNVNQPGFMREVDRLLAEAPPEQWSALLRWRVLNASAAYLGSALSDADFRFGALFSGATERTPRWRRCVGTTSSLMGPALGRLYGRRVFTPVARARAEEMIDNLRAVLRERIAGLEWMGSATRAEALRKVEGFQARLGYPDSIPDYGPLEVRPGSFLTAVRAARQFGTVRDWAKIGKPTDGTEWNTVPQRVSGNYDAQRNTLTYPAAKFQPPFFDPEADDAVNYGALGSTIGHEISHGLDDEGRQYDAAGNLRDWWTPEDAARFKARSDRMVAQYDSFVAVDTVHVNGRLTLGENLADLGGVTISYYALQRSLQGKPRPLIDGLTPEQRFFISWAQNWRANVRDASLRTAARTDPHAPMRLRVIGPLSNLPEFARAFACRPGDPMVRPESVRVEVW